MQRSEEKKKGWSGTRTQKIIDAEYDIGLKQVYHAQRFRPLGHAVLVVNKWEFHFTYRLI